MRIVHENIDNEVKESKDGSLEKNNIQNKMPKEIKDESQVFFRNFSHKQNFSDLKPELDDKHEEEQFLEDIRYLDLNTSLVRTELCDIKNQGYSKEELTQLEENDPGYVNGKVLDYDNENEVESNTYQSTGLHSGAIHWGEYAARESIDYITLDEGKVLRRWGDENGTFLAEPETDYESLELPIVEAKNIPTLYEVIKPFPTEISIVAKQPWNQNKEAADDKEQDTLQYRTPIAIKRLVEEGYLKAVIKN